MSENRNRSNSQVHYNVAVVGGGAVGKSAMTLQFVQHVFCDEYDPTIEDQHRKQVVVDDQCCVMDIIDTAGQEEYTAIRDQYLRSAEGFLLVFSLISHASFEEAKGLYECIIRAKEEESVPVVLVGNKCDVTADEREVTQQEINEFLKGNKITFIEASAKLRTNIDESFYCAVRLIREKVARDQKASKKANRKKHSVCSLL